MRERSAGRRVAGFGILLAVALVLHVAEGFLPTPVPFARLGLANVATLLAVVLLGVADAVLLALLRVVIASFIAGTFMGPGFALSLAGGLAAALAMGIAFRLASPPLGVVGLSLIGAAVHNAAQVAVVGLLFVGASGAVRLLPAALLLSAVTGLTTGLVAYFAIDSLRSRGAATFAAA